MQNVLQTIITDHGAVVFNDDGYTDEWQIEAAERGLPNLRTTLDALPELITEESMELFSNYGVFNHREMHSRYEIALEQYILTIDVEASPDAGDRPTRSSCRPPCATRPSWPPNVGSLKAVGVEVDTGTLDEVSGHRDHEAGLASLRALRVDPRRRIERREARRARQQGLLPAMDAVRAAADALETLVADDLWPLPDLPGDAVHPVGHATGCGHLYAERKRLRPVESAADGVRRKLRGTSVDGTVVVSGAQ